MTAGGPVSPASASEARKRPAFSTRSVADNDCRLAPAEWSPDSAGRNQFSSAADSPYQSLNVVASGPSGGRSRTNELLQGVFRLFSSPNRGDNGSLFSQRLPEEQVAAEEAVRVAPDQKQDRSKSKVRTGPSGTKKLGTFSGVFVPTTLNILSILMFIRFGFILGQSGVLGMMGMLIAAYAISLLTTMSISAIATNGTVRGGGAYYLISRSLGPEFGGSIGVVFYMGLVFSTGMNAVGLVNCLVENFGTASGTLSKFLDEGFWWRYLWATLVLVLCTIICLAGSAVFARASKGLLAVLLIATFSIPVSALFKKPFSNPAQGVEFTGFRLETFVENLKPRLTKGAAGSQGESKETFQSLFGVLFPATSGIFAGASMSGNLKNPSKSIPKGTLSGMLLTFVTYTIVILSMAASITRQSFYNNTNVIQETNLSAPLVFLGEFATSFFSSLMGVIGSAKLLQALARDNLVPGLSIFSQGSKASDEPTYAILFTFVVAQLTMLFDINQIASFITMAYLMTFLATNLACFLLKIGSAPNFRPSFHYFSWQTAAIGALVSLALMFFVDGVYATGCIVVLIALFLMIHYTSPPKSWGDVSQSLIYHQVRKYLLRLKQEHVKFWRPQILLFVNDCDAQYKMISFCNSLKKGALFVLGQVIVTDDFSSAVPEARRQQAAWAKFIEYTKVKAFTNISVAPTVEWGIRNVALNSGLGGMRPNIVVIDQYREGQSLAKVFRGPLRKRQSKSPSARLRRESCSTGGLDDQDFTGAMSTQNYVTVLEDLLFKLRINVAVAQGFENLELPNQNCSSRKRRYIDLWPIQMSAELAADKQHVLTTNFDTYTLILQLGCILHTVPSWRKTHKLRVAVFVEYESDVEEERRRVCTLLEKLRIEAEVIVHALASSGLQTYQIIVNGDMFEASAEALERVNTVLKDDGWWEELQQSRRTSQHTGHSPSLDELPSWPTQQGTRRPAGLPYGELKRLVDSSRRQRRKSISTFTGLNVNLGIRSSRLWEYQADMSEDDSSSSTKSSEDDSYSDHDSIDDDDDHREDGKSATAPFQSGTVSPAVEPPTSRNGGRRRTKSENILSYHRPAEEEEEGGGGEADPDGTASPTLPVEHEQPPPQPQPPTRPSLVTRISSRNRFTSSPIPEAKVNPTEDSGGPSIMFSDSPIETRPATQLPLRESIYHHHQASPRVATAATATATATATTTTTKTTTTASGFPSQASIPLSFNDLPCRAQHLILNELMARHATDHGTAVMFTTLPSPAEGTSLDADASDAYISDMQVLTRGLPPCLLVHSNSMTVTMNL